MNSQRSVRVQRLIEIRRQARDAAQKELAGALATVQRAEASWVQAQGQWKEHAALAAEIRETHSDSIAEAHAYLETLRRGVDRAFATLENARVEAEQSRVTFTNAQTELRKLELWRDKIAEESLETERRLDQRATDEVSARLVQRAR